MNSRLLTMLLSRALAAGLALTSAAQDPAAAAPPVATADAPAADTAVRTALAPAGHLEPRIREITRLHGVMPHMLVGFGLVTGLAGTGASDRGTRQAILNMVRDQGLNLTIADVVGGNTALVSLTASVPPFAKQGQPIDVKVQTIGDATSLRGGQLMRAELRGVDGQTHVVVQGPVLVAGFSAQGSAASVQKNLSTTGWVNNGGLVVRDVQSSFFSEAGDLELQVANPSVFNAESVANGIRRALADQDVQVTAVDPTLVRISLPREARNNDTAMALIARIGELRVPVENPVKIVVDQASGTVLAGAGVLISPCVVGLTDLTISVVDEQEVVQPTPFSDGQTVSTPRTQIQVQSHSSDLKPVAGGASVSELLQNLKALGLTPAQLVSVFQALDDGGFLHAELEVR